MDAVFDVLILQPGVQVGHALVVVAAEIGLHLRTVAKQLEREVRKPHVADALTLIEGFLLGIGELSLVEGKVHQTAEQGDIDGGHFLSGKNHPTIHRSNLALLVPIHVHTRTAGTIPQPLQELALVEVDGVLILIDVHQGIGTLRHEVAQCRIGGILNVGRCVLDDEERHQAMAEFRLTRTFRTEKVQNGEALGQADNDIAEQGSQEEANPHLGIVAEYQNQFLRIVSKGHGIVVGIDKLALELEELHIIAIYQAAAGQIEVPCLQTHDAVFIHRMPLGIETTVAESKEAFALPPQLGNFGSGLGLLIEEHLQLGQLSFGCQPNVVTQSFDLLLELREGNQVFLFHLDDFFLVILVLDAIQTLGQKAILDVEHRQHDEVRPLARITTIGRNGEIRVVLLIEPVLGIEVAVNLLALVEYLLGLHLLLGLIDGRLP